MAVVLLHELLAVRAIVGIQQVGDPLAQELRAPAEHAGDRLVERGADQAEHEVDEDQPDGDVESGEVEHQPGRTTVARSGFEVKPTFRNGEGRLRGRPRQLRLRWS
jgi:hypothetical protein